MNVKRSTGTRSPPDGRRVSTCTSLDLELAGMKTPLAIAVLVTASMSALASAQQAEVRLKFAEAPKGISFDWFVPLESFQGATDLAGHLPLRKVPMHSGDMLFGPNFFPFPKHSFFADQIYLFDRPKAAGSTSQETPNKSPDK
jgi:hypothetical protein